jgi:anti-sigma regulatory factor (Ser/Thr protein kinase)
MSESIFSALEVTVPASPQYLRQLRHLVGQFVRDVGASEGVAADVLLAVNEACSNVVIHAYEPGSGPLRLRAWRSGSGVTFEVSDNGTPAAKPVEGRFGGRGLEIIEAVCADVDIEGPGPYGTRLEMKFTLDP